MPDVAENPEAAFDTVRGEFVVSTHCHNDLGLAVANSLAGVANGARQVECAINGLGERAGNAALEEIVMAIRTRSDYFEGITTGVRTEELARASRMVSRLTGYPVDANGIPQRFDDLPPELQGNVNTVEVPYDRFLGEAPRLTDAELDDLEAFLNTLTDGYLPAVAVTR